LQWLIPSCLLHKHEALRGVRLSRLPLLLQKQPRWELCMGLQHQLLLLLLLLRRQRLLHLLHLLHLLQQLLV
jgi:hypothetical protein